MVSAPPAAGGVHALTRGELVATQPMVINSVASGVVHRSELFARRIEAIAVVA